MNLLQKLDWTIIICVLILLAFGLSTIASVAPENLISQLLFCAIGLGFFFLFARIDHRIFFSLSIPVYLASLILLGVTLFLGFESHGALRWIVIGPFRFQFSEILKPFFCTSFAVFLLNFQKKGFRGFLAIGALLFIPITMVFKQPDLGSAVVYFFGSLLMVISSEASLLYLFLSAIVSIFVLPIGWHFLASYQKNRILTFLQPQNDPLGSSYNAIQSVITVGSGMLFGRGLGRGTQSHLLFLPEHHTDFIFAAIAEEFGFIGAFAVILVYFFLIWRIFTLAISQKDPFSRLVCIGIGGFLLCQVVINIGMNIGILPITGITLPLVSYGGSSMLATMIGLGIVENIHASKKETDSLHIV